MAGAIRTLLDGTVAAEVAKTHTRPVNLVRIDFTTSTVFLSEEGELTHDFGLGEGPVTFLDGAVTVGSFSWNTEGEQVGKLMLLNEKSSASDLALESDTTAGSEVTIYQTYIKADGSHTIPEIMVTGVLDGCEIGADASTFTIYTSAASTEFIPALYYSSSFGFKNLPAPGTVISWNGERFVLEAEDR